MSFLKEFIELASYYLFIGIIAVSIGLLRVRFSEEGMEAINFFSSISIFFIILFLNFFPISNFILGLFLIIAIHSIVGRWLFENQEKADYYYKELKLWFLGEK